ncbi:hypothetical protein FOXYSP1_18338 [Fusarium oxysporum f. sp. phaseoli]
MIGPYVEISDSNFIFLPEHLWMRKCTTSVGQQTDMAGTFAIGERIGRPQGLGQWFIIAPELSSSSVPLSRVRRSPSRTIVG